MKFFKKSAISTAMATALLAGGMVASQQASAYPVLDNAGDPYVSANGMGHALIYPYYTVRNGFKTTFNVFNTSDTHAVAVKVRFREYQNSRDVLDFNLVLSPNDKWSGTVTEAASSGAILGTADSSCTVPAIPAGGAAFSDDGYSFSDTALDFVDSGDQDLERLKSGYIEIIPMAWSNADNDDPLTDEVEGTFAGALHEQPSGIPADCGVVVDAFTPTDTWDLVDLDVGSGDPDIETNVSTNEGGWVAIPDSENPLYGELALINSTGGVAGGTNAVAIADWMNGVTLFTAQEFPFYLEPTLATSAGIWDTTDLPLTDAALNADVVINEWANNPTNGAKVTWAVTMPTKSFHVDIDLDGLGPDGVTVDADNNPNIQAGVNDYRLVGGVGGTVTPLAPFENHFASGVSESTIGLNDMFGSEEGETSGVSGSVSFSPGSFSTSAATLKYEANTISFSGSDGDNVLNSANPLELDPVTDVEGGKVSGHLRLAVNGDGSAPGLPMVGFAMKDRDTGNSALSFGQLLDHKFMSDL